MNAQADMSAAEAIGLEARSQIAFQMGQLHVVNIELNVQLAAAQDRINTLEKMLAEAAATANLQREIERLTALVEEQQRTIEELKFRMPGD